MLKFTQNLHSMLNLAVICDAIKQNESELANINFKDIAK